MTAEDLLDNGLIFEPVQLWFTFDLARVVLSRRKHE
jgi:hypothetical protein